MTAVLDAFTRLSFQLLQATIVAGTVLLIVILVERTTLGFLEFRRRHMERRYQPVVRRALAGDPEARQALLASPSRHQLAIARILILPLVGDRNPSRVAETRAILRAMSFIPTVIRYLRSRWSWRRALALQVLGVLQIREHSAAIVSALDDPDPIIRSAALDALTDLQDPATLPAIVVRLHDASLPHGRRLAALAAFGSSSEPLLLDLMAVDSKHAINYVQALAICGTKRSLPVLCGLTGDPRPEVCVAALEALGRIGVDEIAADYVLAALDSGNVGIRAASAKALRGCADPAVIARLADRLDDVWVVAVRAAHSLRSMGAPGIAALKAREHGPDTAGALARYMLWLQLALA
jgi:HEAT repeats